MIRLCQERYAQKDGFKAGRYPFSRYAAHTDGTIVNMYTDEELAGVVTVRQYEGMEKKQYIVMTLIRDDTPEQKNIHSTLTHPSEKLFLTANFHLWLTSRLARGEN